MLKSILLDSDGKPNCVFEYKYDKKGRITRTTNDYDADGTIDSFCAKEYYKNGKIKEEIRYHKQDEFFNGEFRVLKYDKKGFLVTEVQTYDSLKDVKNRLTSLYVLATHNKNCL